MKKVLITGATGFIGNFLVDEGIKRNYELYAAVRRSSNTENLVKKGVSLIEFDFASVEDIRSKLAGAPAFDIIIHNAGLTKTVKQSRFFEVNFDYTKNLIVALSTCNKIPQKFIYISSLAAAGPGKEDLSAPVSVNDTPAPITNYGLSKLYAERFIAEQPGLPYLIVRPTAVYGPGDKDFFEMFKLIDRRLDMVIGSHKQAYSFIYVKDLTKAIYDLMDSACINKTYFVSDGGTYDKTRMSDLIAEIMQKKIRRFFVPVSLAKIVAALSEGVSKITGKPSVINSQKIKEFSAANWTCDVSPLIQDINFKPEYPLDLGLKETVAWYKLQGWLK